MSTTTVTRGAKPAIDPRIRARRVAVLRGEGRRRLRRLLALGVVAALAGLAFLVTRSPLLDVDHVRVTGAAHTDPATLLGAAGIQRGSAMTDADLGHAEHAIAGLPWVDRVSVHRHWPGDIDIRVTERSPVAVIQFQTAAGAAVNVVVDRTGRVLEQPGTVPADLPSITITGDALAPGQTVPGVAAPLSVAGLLTPDLRAWVVTVVAGQGDTVGLQLKGGVQVSLGSEAHLADKLVDLATVLSRVDLSGLASIDLSVVHTPVLTRQPAGA